MPASWNAGFLIGVLAGFVLYLLTVVVLRRWLLPRYPGGAWRTKCSRCSWRSPRSHREDAERLYISHYLAHVAAGEAPPLPPPT